VVTVLICEVPIHYTEIQNIGHILYLQKCPDIKSVNFFFIHGEQVFTLTFYLFIHSFYVLLLDHI